MVKDILGRPVKKGDIVLTNGYSSPTFTEVTEVIKVNPKTITVKLKDRYAIWANEHRNANLPTQKELKRTSDKFVVITEQDAHNRSTYPEFYI